MSRPIALLDSCVLYPAPLRDLLMHLAVGGLYRARWTAHIHEEWMRNVLANRPDLTGAQLKRTRDLMDAHVLDCLVTGYEGLVADLTLPDPDDRHVLAAAIRAGASLIVTFNLGDFPVAALERYSLEARHPDIFITQLLDDDSAAVCAAVRLHRQSLKRPPKSVDELLDILARQQLTKAVARLRPLSDLL